MDVVEGMKDAGVPLEGESYPSLGLKSDFLVRADVGIFFLIVE